MLAAQVLVSARGPLLSLHIVHPFLEPGVVLQGKPLREVNGWFGLKRKLITASVAVYQCNSISNIVVIARSVQHSSLVPLLVGNHMTYNIPI